MRGKILAWSRNPDHRDTVIVMSGMLAVQLILVVTGVLLARGLGPTDRGHLALLTLVPLTIWQLGSLGLSLSLTYVIARRPVQTRAIGTLIARTAVWQLAILLPLAAIASLALFAGDPGYVKVSATIALILVPASCVQQYALALLQGERRFTAYSLTLVLPLGLFAVGLVAFQVAGSLTLEAATGLFAGTLSAGAIAAGILAVRKLPDAASDSQEIPSLSWLVRFGLKGMLGSSQASPLENYRIDQAIVGIFLAPATLGQYVVAVSLTNLPRFAGRAFGLVAYPSVAGETDLGSARRAMWRFLWASLPVLLLISGGLWLLAPWLIPFFFGSGFHEAISITRILLINSLLVSVRRVLGDGARGVGHPGVSSVAEVVALVLLVPLLAILVPQDEAKGVALALTLSSAAGLAILVAGLRVLRARGPAALPERETPEVLAGP